MMSKTLGIIAGITALIMKIFLIILVYVYHIHETYRTTKSVEIECIATSVGLGIGGVYNVLIFTVGTLFPGRKIIKFIWLKEYALTAASVGCFIQYIHVKSFDFAWSAGILPVVLLTSEFLFFTFFINININGTSSVNGEENQCMKKQ